MASEHSRLNAPEIRAVLEANRTKLAWMQQKQQEEREAHQERKEGAVYVKTTVPASGSAAQATGHAASIAEAAPRKHMHSNPVYGDDAMAGSPAVNSASEGSYEPKLAGVIRPPPIAGLTPDAGLPPVGDLFSAEPRLPPGVGVIDHASSSAPTCFPPWDSQRSFLSARHTFEAAADRADGRTAPIAPQSLEPYPVQVQETMLVDDLLHAFDGLDGTWVRSRVVDAQGGARVEFTIVARGQLEPALLEIATRMLPLCECVAVVQRFVETRRGFAWGLVCQALAGGMRGVLQDWSLMLAQLEHQLRRGKLTMQALWYYVQPPMAALRLVASLAAEASGRRLRGAALLDLLHERVASLLGDAAAHRLALRLLRAASDPYFAVLEKWVCHGNLDDPYEEFMVREDVSVGKEDLSVDGGSAYWSDRWTLRKGFDPATGIAGEKVDVPRFLSEVEAPILDAGKYINLVRSCGIEPKRTLPLGIKLEYDEGGRYLLRIEEAHRSAATAAMQLLRRELEAPGRGLVALKRYFLAAQGDLFLAVMDGGEAELGLHVGQVELPQLQSVLDIAVRGCSAASDPAATRLRAAYDHRSMLNMLIAITSTAAPASSAESPQKRPRLRPVAPAPMTAAEKSTVGRQKRARESFMLFYEVPWPLSVVVPDTAMAHYQMIFRHLFELKWVERELSRVCDMYRATVPLANLQGRARRRNSLVPGSAADAAAEIALSSGQSISALATAYRTCQLMIHFFGQYMLYATFEVLEPLWSALERHVNAATTIDEVIEHHRVFLRKVMKGLLLSRKVVVLRALLGLKDLALSFVSLSSRLIDVDYEALDAEAEAAGLLPSSAGGRRGNAAGVSTERRAMRDMRVRAALDAALSNPDFLREVGALRSKFEARCGDFMSALAEALRQARSERSDSREELESLLNLMGRLDFNGYFTKGGP
jgi:gamma-tubulin complex component 2